MKQNNNEQIVFDMFEEMQPKASLRLGMHTPMKKLMGAIRRRKRLLIMQGRICWIKWEVHKKQNSHRGGSIGFTPSAITALL